MDQPRRKRTYTQIQQMIREEAPSIFLWTQYDTLGISKKVQYAARPDEWLWLFDAKPAAGRAGRSVISLPVRPSPC